MSKFLLGVFSGLVVVIAIGAIIYWRFFLVHPQPDPSSQIVKASPTPKQTADFKKIAYVKDNTIWLINEDGTDKKQLTTQTNAIYPKLSFKNKTELSYIRCTTSCQLVTRNLENNSETTEVDQPQILAFGWSKAGDKLGYIYKLPTNEMKLDLRTNENTNTIKNFSEPNIGGGGRGGSLDDDVSVQFSPNDENILVTNTLGQPNLNDPNTIWIFNIDGKEEIAIPTKDGLWPTQSGWVNNQVIYYKIGNQLYSLNLAIKTSVLQQDYSEGFLNPLLFNNDLTNILWWQTNDTKLPSIRNSDVMGFYKPKILDYPNVIALKADEVPKNQESMLSFLTGGISLVDISSKEVKDLDTGEIGDFTISP